MRTEFHIGSRSRPLWGIILVTVIFLPWVISSVALEIPALRSRVNDYAGMLSESTRVHLDSVLKDLEQETSTQIVVLTIPSLGGEDLESFSIRVAEQWKIGQKGLDNGAILLISQADRKLRIEVGYGLEHLLTDLVCGRIIRDVIVPEFKAGRFDQGVLNGVVAMMNVVKGDDLLLDRIAARAPLKNVWSPSENTILLLVVLALCAPICIIMVGIAVATSLNGARGVRVHRHRRDSPYRGAENSNGGVGLDFRGGGSDFGGSNGGFSGGGGGFGGGGASCAFGNDA